MSALEKVSLFRNGANQAVRIPKEFELSGTSATMRRDGNALIIEPLTQKTLLQVLNELERLATDFHEVADPLPESVDL
jgi:antitoxin VapB